MTTATQTRSWQRYPVGDPAPPDGPPASPALFPLLDWLIAVHGGKSLSVNDLWHDRPVRGGSAPSSHRGAAFDWRYEDPGPGRRYMLDNVLPVLLDESLELDIQQVHDYRGARVWKASRAGDSNGGWARQADGSHSGMMGASWASWLHIEAGEWAWNDGRPVPDKLGGTPPRQEDDMHPAACTWGPGRADLFVTGSDRQLWHRWYDETYSFDWSEWEPLGGILVGPPSVMTWGPGRADIFATGQDGALWQISWANDAWTPWQSLGRQP